MLSKGKQFKVLEFKKKEKDKELGRFVFNEEDLRLYDLKKKGFLQFKLDEEDFLQIVQPDLTPKIGA